MSIKLEHVNYIYEQGTPQERYALKDINLEIGKGQFVGLIGHTGSGKSTLIQMMNGLMKPTDGKVLFEGSDISEKDYSKKYLRSKVGMVFQYPEHQLFETTVFRDVCFGPGNLGWDEEKIHQRAVQALQAMNFPEKYYEQSPFELSGGQKRRVAIAGVLAMDPDFIILDEPTAGLDPAGRDEILELIGRLQKEQNKTMILVSHSMEDVAKYADRILVMNEGQLVMDGCVEDIFQRYKELEQIGLAAPQVTYLMHDLRKRGLDVDVRVTTIEDAKREIQRALCK